MRNVTLLTLTNKSGILHDTNISVTVFNCDSSAYCEALASTHLEIPPDNVTAFHLYLSYAPTAGDEYNYKVSLSNGQVIDGSVVAQNNTAI